MDDSQPVGEDEECSARQIVRQVCVALKRYLEAHLYIRSEQVRRAHHRDISLDRLHSPVLPSYKVSVGRKLWIYRKKFQSGFSFFLLITFFCVFDSGLQKFSRARTRANQHSLGIDVIQGELATC